MKKVCILVILICGLNISSAKSEENYTQNFYGLYEFSHRDNATELKYDWEFNSDHSLVVNMWYDITLPKLGKIQLFAEQTGTYQISGNSLFLKWDENTLNARLESTHFTDEVTKWISETPEAQSQINKILNQELQEVKKTFSASNHKYDNTNIYSLTEEELIVNNPNDGLRLKKIRSVVSQVVMKPHFRVNDEKTYIGLINTIENGDTIKVYFLQKFKVISCDAKGYTIETETIDSEVYYTTWNFNANLMKTIAETKKNNKYIFLVSPQGKIVKLINADSVMSKGKENLDPAWEMVFWGLYPDMFPNLNAQMQLRHIVYSGLTEEGFLQEMGKYPLWFSLYGREFKDQEVYFYESEEKLKMKRHIKSISKDKDNNYKFAIVDNLEMTQQERKQLVRDLLSKQYSSAEINKIFDAAYKESGLEELDTFSSSIIRFNSELWPSSITCVDQTNEKIIEYYIDLKE